MKKSIAGVALLICASITSANSVQFDNAAKGIVSSCAYIVQNYNLNQPSSPTVEDQCRSCITKDPKKRTKEVIAEATKQCVEKILSKGEK